MAFTDNCDLFGSVHEDGINLVVRHFMRQRPSLFNYATPIFHGRNDLFCRRIEAAKSVQDAGNPFFTEQEPLPVIGTPFPMGINFCVQLTEARVDFHPGSLDLPPELGELKEQGFALWMSVCAGLDCPSQEVIDEYLPWIERELLRQQKLAVGKVGRDERDAVSIFQPNRPDRNVVVLPTRNIECFCLDLFAVGHFEWGLVSGSDQVFLKTRLDALEIVDIGPQPLEQAIECYISTTLRLGILPQMMVPLEKMVLDITAVLEEQGLQLGKEVRLAPSSAPSDVPHNPAIEDDMLKAFAKLSVTDGGA